MGALRFPKLHAQIIEHEIIELEKYHEMIEGLLKIEKGKLEESYDEKEMARLEKEEYDYYHHLIDLYSEEWQLVGKQFPHNFRSTFLVQIISFIEHHLQRICDHHCHTTKSTLSDFSSLDGAKKYLTSICNLKFDNYNKEWLFIHNCKKLRNKVVHTNSVFKGSDKSTFSFVKASKSIEHDCKNLHVEELGNRRYSFLIVNRDLNFKLIENAKMFFEKFLDDLVYEMPDSTKKKV